MPIQPRATTTTYFVHILTMCLMLLSSSACQKSSPKEQPKPTTFTSPSAPYQLTLPPGWSTFNPDIFENGAELAANNHDQILMVIASPIAPKPNAPKDAPAPQPDLEYFSTTAIAQLKKDVDEFSVVSKQQQNLSPRIPAVILIADGKVNQNKARYMIAYTGLQGWHIQLVAWSHPSNVDALSKNFDAILSSFKTTQTTEIKTKSPQTP